MTTNPTTKVETVQLSSATLHLALTIDSATQGKTFCGKAYNGGVIGIWNGLTEDVCRRCIHAENHTRP